VILDFTPGWDRIDLSGYRGLVGRDAEAVFLGEDAFRPEERSLQVRTEAEEGGTILQFYVPFEFGTARTVYEIELAGLWDPLSEQDLVL
jgi:hypothetical protein